MKNKVFILFLSMFSVQFLAAQNEKVAVALEQLNNDTASYIKQNIIANKNAYMGQSLDKLLEDLPTVLRYTADIVTNNTSLSTGIVLHFSSVGRVKSQLDNKKIPLMITIKWEIPVETNELVPLGLKLFGGQWSQIAYNYYKNRVIESITGFNGGSDYQ